MDCGGKIEHTHAEEVEMKGIIQSVGWIEIDSGTELKGGRLCGSKKRKEGRGRGVSWLLAPFVLSRWTLDCGLWTVRCSVGGSPEYRVFKLSDAYLVPN